MEPLALQLIFPKGDPNGLKIIELTGWNGKALIVPRTEVRSLRDLSEVKSGLYFLFGEDEQTGEDLVYIGESGDCAWRLGAHDEKKDFWNQAFIFLNPPNRNYLESIATRLSRDAKRYSVQNGVQPKEEDQAEFDRIKNERYFDGVKKIFATFGISLFESVSEASVDSKMYSIKGDAVEARARLLDDGSLNVISGSRARIREVNSFTGWAKAARRKYLEEGTLIESGDGVSYMFTKDVLFKSPSAAAATLAGRPINGWTAWKDEAGNSLDENLRK